MLFHEYPVRWRNDSLRIRPSRQIVSRQDVKSAPGHTRQSRRGIAGRYEAPASVPVSSVVSPSTSLGHNVPDPSRQLCKQAATKRQRHRHRRGVPVAGGGWRISCLLARSCLSCDGPLLSLKVIKNKKSASKSVRSSWRRGKERKKKYIYPVTAEAPHVQVTPPASTSPSPTTGAVILPASNAV